jgi:hypothetical protein
MTASWTRAGHIFLDLESVPGVLRLRCRAEHREGAIRWLTPRDHTNLYGCDATALRPKVDLTVSGFAYASQKDARFGKVRLECGAVSRTVAVSGPRNATIDGGLVEISSPEAFDRVALDPTRAFGGGNDDDAYVRNPLGTGFVAAGTSRGSVVLPQLEDPQDLLTAERLVPESRDAYWALPLPALLGPIPVAFFPRVLPFRLYPAHVWAGMPTDSRLAEVRHGGLPSGFDPTGQFDPALAHQEASARSRLDAFQQGDVVTLEGCSADSTTLRLQAPRAPALHATIDGRRAAHALIPQSVEVAAEERCLRITYGADLDLGRVFIPGIHKKIPIALQLEGAEPIPYPTPPTMRDRLRRAQETA